MSDLYLLDTNVVLALIRGKALGAFIDSTFNLSAGKRRPMISVVTHGEVRVSPDGGHLGTASWDGRVFAFDLSHLARALAASAHAGAVPDAAASE